MMPMGAFSCGLPTRRPVSYGGACASSYGQAWKLFRAPMPRVLCARAASDGAQAQAVQQPPSASAPPPDEQPREASSMMPNGDVPSRASATRKVNRSLRIMESRSRQVDEQRMASLASAFGLLILSVYGRDLITLVGTWTTLPVEEVQGIIFFLITFELVSLVLPRSKYNK